MTKKLYAAVFILLLWLVPSFSLAQTDLAVSLAAPTTPITVGSTLSVTVNVQNLGSNAASSVSIRYILPREVTFVSSVTASGVYNSPIGTWLIGHIAAGQSVSLTIQMQAASTGYTYHRIENLSLSGTDTNPDNNSATQTIEIRSPSTLLYSESQPSFSFNSARSIVTLGGKSIKLSSNAYKVFVYLYTNRGRAFSASELVSNALEGLEPTMGFDAIMQELSTKLWLAKYIQYSKNTQKWLFKN